MTVQFHRRPVRYKVTVDGRAVGEPFPSSAMAEEYADQLRSEAPWAVIGVTQTY